MAKKGNMTDETQDKGPLTMVFRVQEWGTMFEVTKDPMIPQLRAMSGETGIEIMEGERLADLDVIPHGNVHYIPIPANGDTPPRNVPVKTMLFRATLARVVRGPIPEDTEPSLAEQAKDKPKVELPPGVDPVQ